VKNPGVSAAYLAAGFLPVLLWFWPVPLQKLADNPSLAGFLRYVPVLALAGAGFMGWKLNQTRVLLGSLLCMFLYGLLLEAGTVFLPATIPAVQDALVISLPLAFALAVAGHESPLMDRRFVHRVILAFLPLLVLGLAAAGMRDGLLVATNWAPGGWSRPLDLPWLGIGTVALYWVALGISHDRRIRWFSVALGMALVPVIFAVRALDAPPGRVIAGLPGIHVTMSFLAVSLILFHAVFFMYWHRVYIDELTGVPNRRALEEELLSAGDTFTVAMIDIDHFKEYNDRFGHEEGDNVLRMVAGHLERELNSRVYRYGGEEFCALWLGGPLDGAFKVMENARCSLEKRVFHVRPPRHETGSVPPDSALGVAVGVTVSAGLAASSAGMKPEEVLRKSDEALYEAKRTGRNRTVIAS
jgi:diguanylate cyclase (GGDEF)-like protein